MTEASEEQRLSALFSSPERFIKWVSEFQINLPKYTCIHVINKKKNLAQAIILLNLPRLNDSQDPVDIEHHGSRCRISAMHLKERFNAAIKEEYKTCFTCYKTLGKTWNLDRRYFRFITIRNDIGIAWGARCNNCCKTRREGPLVKYDSDDSSVEKFLDWIKSQEAWKYGTEMTSFFTYGDAEANVEMYFKLQEPLKKKIVRTKKNNNGV